jgi:hypothetical protein
MGTPSLENVLQCVRELAGARQLAGLADRELLERFFETRAAEG